MVDLKFCPRCSAEKPHSHFSKERKQKDGLAGYCKSCMREYSRERYRSRPDLKKKAQEAHRNKTEAEKEESRRMSREWRQKNPDYMKNYYRNNAEKMREYQRSGKYRNNPKNIVSSRVRNRFRKILNSKRGTLKTNEMIGCSPAFLKGWLEAKFQKGMTWENRSEWHIDHIIPCASFDLSDPAQIKKCFHYSNLQPLWAEHNMEKKAKVDGTHTMELEMSLLNKN